MKLLKNYKKLADEQIKLKKGYLACLETNNIRNLEDLAWKIALNEMRFTAEEGILTGYFKTEENVPLELKREYLEKTKELLKEIKNFESAVTAAQEKYGDRVSPVGYMIKINWMGTGDVDGLVNKIDEDIEKDRRRAFLESEIEKAYA